MGVKLSILCTTYNHENYIRQTLDGFLMQKTDFEYEVLIHDDASTDNTQAIIKEYEEKYPDIIKPIYQIENKWSKGGVHPQLKYNIPRVQGEYIAFCDGDDYWTDPNKLQKQVDFLETHTDYVICAHQCELKFEGIDAHKINHPTKRYGEIKQDDLYNTNYFFASSVVWRWDERCKINLEKLVPKKILTIDWYMNLLMSQKGKMYILQDVMSVYRINKDGLWSDYWFNQEKCILKRGKYLVNFYYYVYNNITDKSRKFKYLGYFEIKNVFTTYYKNYCIRECLYIEKLFPDIIDKIKTEQKIQDNLFFDIAHRRFKKYQKLFTIFAILSGIFFGISVILLTIIIMQTKGGI